jgi:hypothetical protein
MAMRRRTREVLRGILDAHATLVLAEGHIEHPVHAVFDALGVGG